MGRRFLLINQFYPPDPAPTGRLLHEVATELVRRGHYVRVLCSRKEYGTGRDLGPSILVDGVDVRRVFRTPFDARRLRGRMADDGLFLVRAALGTVLRSPRVDLVLAATSPPLIGLVAALAHRCRGLAHAHWMMDVYPDVLEAHGWIQSGSARGRALKSMARFQFDRAALILTLGPYMAERVALHLADRSSLQAVPLWSDLVPDAAALDAAAQMRRGRGWGDDDLVLLYSGNMGEGIDSASFSRRRDSSVRTGPSGLSSAEARGGARSRTTDGGTRKRGSICCLTSRPREPRPAF